MAERIGPSPYGGPPRHPLGRDHRPQMGRMGHAGLATTIALEATPEQVAAAANAVAAPPPPPPALPSWDDCAEQLHHLYREVTA